MLLETQLEYNSETISERKFQREPPTPVTITGIGDKFEVNGTVQNVHEKKVFEEHGHGKEERKKEDWRRKSVRKNCIFILPVEF